ncbi:MAG: beta-ketoacyl-[acyl-carrier-protein] synthase family protein, partial [Thermodesulfovibrionales bacterium]
MAGERRVVITGIGPLASPGIGKDAFWEGILKKRTGLRLEEISIDGELWDRFYLHKIDDFDIEKFDIEKEILDDIKVWKNGKDDIDLFYLLAAVKLALDDSGLSYDKEQNNIGLFLTVEHPGFEIFCERIITEAVKYLEENSPVNKLSKHKLFRYIYDRFSRPGYDLQTFMYLYFVAKAFGLHGYSLFTNNACASGLFALESAVRQIKYGQSNIALVASGDVANTMFKHLWFKEQGFYAEDGRIKPFSKNANGIVLGDGASAIVLEELNHALNRKAHIYAEYLSGGFSLEGWKVTIPQIGSSSYQNSIKSALKRANLKPEDIDLINPHGVAIKVTDTYESRAITDVFGENSNKPLITAFKPYIGHNLGGCAILESIILLLSLENNLIPPTLNCEEIEPKHNIELVKELMTYSFKNAMKLSCGFAGYNGAV